MKKYSEKLKDPKWQKKRLEILERDGWCCRRCGDNENTLHVHHLAYEKGKDPWEYNNDHLLTLCERCHEYEHTAFSEFMEMLRHALKSNGFLADDVYNLATSIGLNMDKTIHLPEVLMSAICWSLSEREELKRMVDRYFEHLSKNIEEK